MKLAFLAPLLGLLPCLLAACSSEEGDSRLTGDPSSTAAATAAEIARFFARLGHSLSDDVAETVRDRTGGNPFFLSEVGRSWQSTPPCFQLTEGVRAHVQHRMQLLSPECRSLIEVASVVGREFSRHELLACMGEAPQAPGSTQTNGMRTSKTTWPMPG